MRKMTIRGLIALCCCLRVSGQPLSADTPPELGKYSVNATWPAVVAADWTAPESEWVSSVLLYVGWQTDSFGEIDSIGLSIYDNAIHGQGTCWYNQPENLLWSCTATDFEIGSPSIATDARTWCNPNPVAFTDADNSYSFPVPLELDSVDWFWTEIGETYWLGVSLFPADPDEYACGVISLAEQQGEHAASALATEWEWITLDYYYVQGDVTCDDVVDETDYGILYQGCGVGIFPPYIFPGGEQGVNGDYNCDGLANITDCVWLLQWWQGVGPPPATNCLYEPRDPVEAAILPNTTAAPYICGDPNRDGLPNVTDCVYLVQYIFTGGLAPDPLASGDPNCDGMINITDAVYLLAFIFAEGPAPCELCP